MSHLRTEGDHGLEIEKAVKKGLFAEKSLTCIRLQHSLTNSLTCSIVFMRAARTRVKPN